MVGRLVDNSLVWPNLVPIRQLSFLDLTILYCSFNSLNCFDWALYDALWQLDGVENSQRLMNISLPTHNKPPMIASYE